MSLFIRHYIQCESKRWHSSFKYNFDKYRPIFKIYTARFSTKFAMKTLSRLAPHLHYFVKRKKSNIVKFDIFNTWHQLTYNICKSCQTNTLKYAYVYSPVKLITQKVVLWRECGYFKMLKRETLTRGCEHSLSWNAVLLKDKRTHAHDRQLLLSQKDVTVIHVR